MEMDRLLALIGCVHGVVLELDGDARYLNAWADDLSLLARPPAELIGRTIDDVLGKAIGGPFTASVKRVYATGRGESFEYELELPAGHRWFLADVRRVGAPATVVLFARDVTERKALQARIAHNERLASIGVLAARVGHEINNPLTYVIGNLEIALGDLIPPGPSEVRTILTESLEGARRIAGIVRRLRTISDSFIPAQRDAEIKQARPSLPRVLVVDDEPAIGRLVQRLLARTADVSAVTSGRDALSRIAEGGPFELVLCDLMMPEMTGMDLYEAVCTADPEHAPRFVFMTGGVYTTRAQTFIEKVGLPTIDKPLEAATLRAVFETTVLSYSRQAPRRDPTG
jgi:CheY-like chemotaxis protein